MKFVCQFFSRAFDDFATRIFPLHTGEDKKRASAPSIDRTRFCPVGLIAAVFLGFQARPCRHLNDGVLSEWAT